MNYLLPAIAAGTVAGAAYFLGDIPTKDSMDFTGSTGPTTSMGPAVSAVSAVSVGPAGPAGFTGIGNVTEISTITPNLKEKITETAAVTDTPQSPEPKKQESEESEEPSEPKEPSEEPEEISPETAAAMKGGGKELKGGAIGVPNWGRDAKLLIKDTVVSQGDLFSQLNKLNEEISELEQKEKEASFYSSNSNVELKTLYEKNKEKIIKIKKNEERRNFLINILKNSVSSNSTDKSLVGGGKKGKGTDKKQQATNLYNGNKALYNGKYGKDRAGKVRTPDQIIDLIIQNELGGNQQNQPKLQITEEDRKKKKEEIEQLEYKKKV